jgi:dCTP deaminase
MMLSDNSIIEAVRNNRIQIRPQFREKHLRPVGIRVHLGYELLIPVPGQTINFSSPDEIKYQHHDLRNGPYTLAPGEFVLGSTIEKVKTASDLLCVLEGRSTIARLGISIHNTASILDGANDSWLTPVLEIANHGNFSIVLCFGVPIGMLCFNSLEHANSRKRFQMQYASQDSVAGPNLADNALVDTFDS